MHELISDFRLKEMIAKEKRRLEKDRKGERIFK